MQRFKRALSGFIRKALPILPRMPIAFKAAQFYVNWFNGDDNESPETNGEWRLLRQVLPRCKVVFDVGANIGEWASEAMRINPAIDLHCFEPAAGAFARLSALCLDGNVKCNCLALSDKSGDAQLFTFGDAAQTNSLYPRESVDWIGESQVQTIRIETLDAYCASNGVERIDYLKLDTEGHELSVFRGMTNLLDGERIRYLQFEYGGAYLELRATLGDIIRLMSGRPYRLYKILPTMLLSVNRYAEALETFRLSNWVFVHQSEQRLG